MCGPQFCSMKITEDVRAYAREQGLDVDTAVHTGLRGKAREFASAGGELYGAPAAGTPPSDHA
jgi:phosphomethylpyrimidine synthase